MEEEGMHLMKGLVVSFLELTQQLLLSLVTMVQLMGMVLIVGTIYSQG
jgi:hypothetical protein